MWKALPFCSTGSPVYLKCCLPKHTLQSFFYSKPSIGSCDFSFGFLVNDFHILKSHLFIYVFIKYF